MTMKNKFSNDEVNSLNIFHMFDQKIEKNISNENCTSFFIILEFTVNGYTITKMKISVICPTFNSSKFIDKNFKFNIVSKF